MEYAEGAQQLMLLLIVVAIVCFIGWVCYYLVLILLPNILLGIIGMACYSHSCTSRSRMRCALRAISSGVTSFMILAILPTILFLNSHDNIEKLWSGGQVDSVTMWMIWGWKYGGGISLLIGGIATKLVPKQLNSPALAEQASQKVAVA